MLHTLRYLIRLSFAFVKRFKGLIFGGILIGIILFLIFGFLGPKFMGKSVKRIGITGRYHSDSLPRNIQEMIGKGLTSVNDSGEVAPDLAKKWETPDKGKTWIFTLNDNIYWQDKTLITSKDINYNFSDVEIEKPDDKTIIFKLKDKFSPFPSVVSQPIFKKGLLGAGDWKIQDIILSGSFVQQINIEKKKEKQIIRFYPTEETSKNAFKMGKVDILEDLYNPTPFIDWKTTQVIKTWDKNLIVTLFFNTQDPILSEKTLRQALFYAINKNFDGPRAISPISQYSWAYNPQVKTYDFDQKRAKEIIDALPEEAKVDLKINLVSAPVLLPIAEKIAQDWKNAGIDSQILVSSVIPQDFQAYLAIFEIPKDPDQYAIWHSTQESTNISNYKNPRIDKLLEDGRAELDLNQRRSIYLDFQRFLLEDVPAAFLYNPSTYQIVRK